jgi:hypothetical protein
MSDLRYPPCIVCGAPRSQVRGLIRHDAAVHDERRQEFKRYANLLRPRCPVLRGLAAVMEYYGEEPVKPPRAQWGVRVNKMSGEVTHHIIKVEQPEAQP